MYESLPPILTTFNAFQQHIEAQLQGLLGHDVGDPWLRFSMDLIKLSDVGKKFPILRANSKKTRDKGWDFSGQETEIDDRNLYGQAKFKVNDKNILDSVISDWVALAGVPHGQLTLEGLLPGNTRLHFVLVTLSDLTSQILPAYRRSLKPAAQYFNMWEREKRVTILDGPAIWRMFRDRYLKTFGDPKPIELSFSSPYTNYGNVYVGIVAASEIKRIYAETGDMIFFENVRDFVGRSDVNDTIATTIREAPEQFLQLNNGIAFSSNVIHPIDDCCLKLERASIVNGCQTTVTLVDTDPPEGQECHVLVKIVQIHEEAESWDVTHAANFQNEIRRIDLDLARFIRPQVVRKMGYWVGMPIADKDDAWSILAVFGKQDITWRNVRIIFIGLFSRDPGNMFDVRWDLVEESILRHYFQQDEDDSSVFEVVFNLHLAAERGAEFVRKDLESAGDEENLQLFKRLLGDTRAPYMQFLAILAACALVDINIAERAEHPEKEIARMNRLFRSFREVFENRVDELDYAFWVAFDKVSSDVMQNVDSDSLEAISSRMHDRITRKGKFTNFFRQVKIGIQVVKRGREVYGDPAEGR